MCALARASRSPQLILSQRTVKVPDGVKVEVKARKVTVSGPRGTLTREFKHIQLDIILQDPSTVRVDMWFGKRKAIACIRTICSHIENMITGVTKGYLYKMRFVYSHFPINVTLSGRTVEIRNYLGEKLVRRVKLVDGVDYVRTADVKDQIELSGNDINAVSLTAANLQQTTKDVAHDIRKFLDGLYVSEKGHVVKDAV